MYVLENFLFIPYFQKSLFRRDHIIHMKVNRRNAIRRFLFISACTLLVPSCVREYRRSSVRLRYLDITGDDEHMLAELAETLIPGTDTPGAKDVSAHLFALRMVDDCRSKQERELFMDGLRAFNILSQKDEESNFADLDKGKRISFLRRLEDGTKPSESIDFFYGLFRKYTIQGYRTSEFFLTKVQVYELIPSRYLGCRPA